MGIGELLGGRAGEVLSKIGESARRADNPAAYMAAEARQKEADAYAEKARVGRLARLNRRALLYANNGDIGSAQGEFQQILDVLNEGGMPIDGAARTLRMLQSGDPQMRAQGVAAMQQDDQFSVMEGVLPSVGGGDKYLGMKDGQAIYETPGGVEARDISNFKGGGESALSVPQQSHNRTVKLARKTLMNSGMNAEQIRNSSVEFDEFGRTNDDYNPFIASVAREALKTLHGNDPNYEKFYRKFTGLDPNAEPEEAPATEEVQQKLKAILEANPGWDEAKAKRYLKHLEGPGG